MYLYNKPTGVSFNNGTAHGLLIMRINEKRHNRTRTNFFGCNYMYTLRISQQTLHVCSFHQQCLVQRQQQREFERAFTKCVSTVQYT